MGQAGDSHRRASLDDKKERAAGRLKEQKTRLPLEEEFGQPHHGQVGGAFGGPDRGPASDLSQGAGGGGASQQSAGG